MFTGVFHGWKCWLLREAVLYSFAVFGYGIVGAWLFSLTRPPGKRQDAMFTGALLSLFFSLYGLFSACARS